jgi:multiple sugar transport system substrate-binding protein
MRIIPRLFSIMVMMAVLLSACAPATPTAAVTAPTANSAQPSTEKVTLNLWIFEGEQGFLPTLKEGFERKFPNITLEITEIPESDYVTKIDTALAAGSTPDIAFIYESRWMKAGKFLPIDDMVNQKGIKLEEYNQGIVKDMCTLNGKLYCLGTYTGAVLLFYNKDMFDAAGVPYPSTTVPMSIDEYEAVATKLTQPNEDITKRVYGGSAGGSNWWSDQANRFSSDGRKYEGYVNDQATIHEFEVLADMIKRGYSPSTADSTLLGDVDLLSTKQQAMMIIDNIIAIKDCEEAKINWGAAPVPVETKGDKAWVPSWTDAMGVFTQSKHPQEALEFIAYMATDGNELRVKYGSYPLNNKIAKEADWAGASVGRNEAMQVINLAREGVFVPGFWDVTGAEGDAFNYIIEGTKTAKDALDEAAKLGQEQLDKAWETWDAIK